MYQKSSINRTKPLLLLMMNANDDPTALLIMMMNAINDATALLVMMNAINDPTALLTMMDAINDTSNLLSMMMNAINYTTALLILMNTVHVCMVQLILSLHLKFFNKTNPPPALFLIESGEFYFIQLHFNTHSKVGFVMIY